MSRKYVPDLIVLRQGIVKRQIGATRDSGYRVNALAFEQMDEYLRGRFFIIGLLSFLFAPVTTEPAGSGFANKKPPPARAVGGEFSAGIDPG